MSSMRVVIAADPELPVPPRLYGGIERVIALLVDGLVERGAEVTLVAHRDSMVSSRVVAYATESGQGVRLAMNASLIAQTVRRARPHVVHSFGRLASLAAVWLLGVPTIMSYQRAITPRSVAWGKRLGGSRLHFTACSDRMLDGVRHLADWTVIYNAVDTARYRFANAVPADAPFVFLGRVEPIKGTHLAIEVAKRTGRRLVVAGTVADEHRAYFDSAIRPHLDDRCVTYFGPVDDEAKSHWLSSAAALLVPVQWEEPFGIVMSEALACGTPVLGLARGAVPEVVDDGVTGAVCETIDDLVRAAAHVDRYDRAACRRAADARFSQPVLVDAYLSLYHRVARVAS